MLVGIVVLAKVVNGPAVDTTAVVSLTGDVVETFPLVVVVVVVVLPSVVVVVLPSVVVEVVTFPVKIVVEVVVGFASTVVVEVVSPGAGQTTCMHQSMRPLRNETNSQQWIPSPPRTRTTYLVLLIGETPVTQRLGPIQRPS